MRASRGEAPAVLGLNEGVITVPTTPPIDPATKGVRVMLEDAACVRILDAIITGGFDPATGAGWKTNPAGTAWRYRNAQGPSGIVKVRVRQRGTTPGKLGFVVTGQHRSYALSAASMPLHTVGAAPKLVAVVGVTNRDGNETVTGVKYGGTPLTRIGFRNGHGNANRVEIWSLTAPSPGTANVVVSLSGSVDVVGGAISFSGVNQTTPFGTFVSAQGTSASPSVTASSAAGQVVLDTLAIDGDAVSASAGAGQTVAG